MEHNYPEVNARIALFDLPTFPKGVLSLSLINVASCLATEFNVRIIDLNFSDPHAYIEKNDLSGISVFGLKVSSQNFDFAIQISNRLKTKYPSASILWGGELPTLLPDICKPYADCIVTGLFEPVVNEFIYDLKHGQLKTTYNGHNNAELDQIPQPRFDLVEQKNNYYRFMGLPLETSRGCTEKCAFCMVHVMQKKNYFLRNFESRAGILNSYKGEYVNIVDYNFGVNKTHVIEVSNLLKQACVTGWMAEMCIEELDDDEMLRAMSISGCKIIYCGLESIDDKALASVHKMNTNHVDRYERIIRKVQSHGIQIAAGIIIGLENMNESTFTALEDFFNRMGLMYAKLTFLTYNPGTKVQAYMKKKGEFCTEDITHYDGNHLTYIPTGLDLPSVLKGTQQFIPRFYSLGAIIKRSGNTRHTFLSRVEFILFNLCYRDAYLQWMKENLLYDNTAVKRLMQKAFKKSITTCH